MFMPVRCWLLTARRPHATAQNWGRAVFVRSSCSLSVLPHSVNTCLIDGYDKSVRCAVYLLVQHSKLISPAFSRYTHRSATLFLETSSCPPIWLMLGLKGALCAMMESNRFSFLAVATLRSAYCGISVSMVAFTTCCMYRLMSPSANG